MRISKCVFLPHRAQKRVETEKYIALFAADIAPGATRIFGIILLRNDVKPTNKRIQITFNIIRTKITFHFIIIRIWTIAQFTDRKI